MFRGLFEGWTPVIIIVVIVLLFGAPKLPGLARSLGQSLRIFRGEMKQMKQDKNADSDKASEGVTRKTSSTASSSKTASGNAVSAKSVSAKAPAQRATTGSTTARATARNSATPRKPSAK